MLAKPDLVICVGVVAGEPVGRRNRHLHIAQGLKAVVHVIDNALVLHLLNMHQRLLHASSLDPGLLEAGFVPGRGPARPADPPPTLCRINGAIENVQSLQVIFQSPWCLRDSSDG